nr:1-deoxy-D-xylulose-5-phosphate synthase N-terminal domain-containing protein [Dysosmobacter welbionis]
MVFDVGHQCYVHKALTGRQALFSTPAAVRRPLRLPKPRESEHDAFIAGHASNSVSVALGMARARTLQHLDYSVLALIGDGALTGDLPTRAQRAGASGEPLIVLLNDNGMSINPNVGAVDSHLSQIRSSRLLPFQEVVPGPVRTAPHGEPALPVQPQGQDVPQKALWPGSTLFEDMGFTYLGPIDGHDLDRLVHVLAWARSSSARWWST